MLHIICTKLDMHHSQIQEFERCPRSPALPMWMGNWEMPDSVKSSAGALSFSRNRSGKLDTLVFSSRLSR